ncbi:MAG: phosphocholine cytidylyltransferase family protein [Pyrinomonadaceae bacterium]
MKAVLLVAGRSTRLYPLTLDKPKCLLEVGGRTLLEHQLDALALVGIDELILVTGYLREMIEAKIDEVRARYPYAFKYVFSPDFATTNNLHSLWAAHDDLLDTDFLCLHADVLFHPGILQSAASDDRDIVLVAEPEILQETMKLQLDGDCVTSVGKHISMKEAHGTFPGIAKFSALGSRLLFPEIEDITHSDEKNAYFTMAVESLIKQGQEVSACFTAGLPWIEIDFAAELVEAEERVLPLIRSSI